MGNGGDPRIHLWAIILLGGCACMFLAFFMPWWGITFPMVLPPKMPERLTREDARDPDRANAHREAMKKYSDEIRDYSEKWSDEQKKAVRILERKESWYEAKIGKEEFRDYGKKAREDRKVSTYRLWGWNFGTAITGFVFSIVLIPVAVVPMFVRLLRNWMWIGYFVAAVSGLVLFILSLVWYFTCPYENVSGYLSQGVGWYPGPYLEILGSLATLTVGILGGVFGLVHFLRSLKAGGPPRRKRKPRDDEFEDDYDYEE